MLHRPAIVFLLTIIAGLGYLFCGCRSHQNKLNPAEQAIKQRTIALLPYNGFNTALFRDIKNEIAGFYHCSIKILPAQPLPASAWYAPRSRYKADSLLVFQQAFASNVDAVAGFTAKDISTSNGSIPDWGVFGLGYCPGKACVISVYRLQKASNTTGQLKERLIKVVLHELGHNFGLPHCSQSATCLMADAGGTLAQVNREQKALCDACRKKLLL
jgi:archaemetzincin